MQLLTKKVSPLPQVKARRCLNINILAVNSVGHECGLCSTTKGQFPSLCVWPRGTETGVHIIKCQDAQKSLLHPPPLQAFLISCYHFCIKEPTTLARELIRFTLCWWISSEDLESFWVFFSHPLPWKIQLPLTLLNIVHTEAKFI